MGKSYEGLCEMESSLTMEWTDIHKKMMSSLDSTLSRSIAQLYEDNHIPMVIRRKYSQWFEEQNWHDAQTQQTAKELYEELLTSINCDIDHLRQTEPLVFEAVELTHAKSKFEENFAHVPLGFVTTIIHCLEEQRSLIAGYTGPEKMDEEQTEEKVVRNKYRNQLDVLENKIMHVVTLTTKANDHLANSKSLQETLMKLEGEQSNLPELMNGQRESYLEYLRTQMAGTRDIICKNIDEFAKTKMVLQQYLHEAQTSLSVLTQEILEEVKSFKQMQKLAYVRAESATKVQAYLKEIEEWCGELGSCCWKLLKQTQNPDLMEVISTGHQMSPDNQQLPMATLATTDQLDLDTIRKELIKEFQELLTSTFLVTVQPPDRIIMTKERGAKSSGGASRAPLNASVSILALNCLQIEQIASQVTAEFTAESDIGRSRKSVKCNLEGNKAQFKKVNNKKSEACFSELKVTDFSRGKDEGRVSRQFYRVFFKTSVTLQSELHFDLQTVSLPIIKNTGSNQACEAIGSLLWYCYNTTDVWSDLSSATFPNEVPLDRVISMLNACLKAIGPRELKDDERKFLSEKLTGKATKKTGQETTPTPKVSFNQFCVNKMRINKTKSVEFSFWKWFHAVINLIDKHLRDPWKDGVIKGFVSRSQVERMLKSQPEGTFLIRFSESCVSGDHQGVTGGFVVAFKCQDKVIYTPPRVKEHLLKASLPSILKQFINMDKNREPLLKYLYRTSCHRDTRENTFDKYKIQCEKSNYSGYPGWIALMGLENAFSEMSFDSSYDPSKDIWKMNDGISYPTPATRIPATRSKTKRRRTSDESLSPSPPAPGIWKDSMDSSNSQNSGNIPTILQEVQKRPPSVSSVHSDIQSFLHNFATTTSPQMDFSQSGSLPLQSAALIGGAGLTASFTTNTTQHQLIHSHDSPQRYTDQVLQPQHAHLVNNPSPQSASSYTYSTDQTHSPEHPQLSPDLYEIEPTLNLMPNNNNNQSFLDLINRDLVQ